MSGFLLAVLASLSISSAQGSFQIERISATSGAHQTCVTPRGAGRQCCLAPQAGELDPVTLCFDAYTSLVEVNAGSYGYFSITTNQNAGRYYGYLNNNADTGKWPLYGGVESVTINQGNQFCHGSQCCSSGASDSCRADAQGQSDAVIMTRKNNYHNRLGLAPETIVVETQPVNKPWGPTQYEVTVKADSLASIQGTGGPFYNEALMITPMSTPEPPPAPVPTPPSPSSSDNLIDEFNDSGVGIAFTVIPENVWEGHGGGNNGMDAAGFFSLNDMYTYHAKSQQAVSIVTRVQDMTPYDGGYGTWGLAFHVTENHDFWKYFQVAMHGKNVLVAGPGDGANHIPGTSDWRHTIVQEGKSYEWFKNQKNGILARYNTVYHNHDYNEFDTNGLAPDGLAGVFVNEQYNKPGPSHQSMCNFLMRANPSKSSWPVYGYKWHNLYIKEVLNCANTVVV